MLSQALTFLTKTLNQKLRESFTITEDIVIMNNLINQDGTQTMGNQNKVILSIVDVDLDKKFRNEVSFKKQDAEKVLYNNALNYTVTIILSSNIADYLESLKYLDASMAYFRETTVFNNNTFTEFPTNIKQITIEINSLNLRDKESIWAIIGTKYQPSIIYKMQLIENT